MKAPFAFVENTQTSLCFQAGAAQWSMVVPALRPLMVPRTFGDKVEIIMRAYLALSVFSASFQASTSLLMI